LKKLVFFASVTAILVATGWTWTQFDVHTPQGVTDVLISKTKQHEVVIPVFTPTPPVSAKKTKVVAVDPYAEANARLATIGLMRVQDGSPISVQ